MRKLPLVLVLVYLMSALRIDDVRAYRVKRTTTTATTTTVKDSLLESSDLTDSEVTMDSSDDSSDDSETTKSPNATFLTESGHEVSYRESGSIVSIHDSTSDVESNSRGYLESSQSSYRYPSTTYETEDQLSDSKHYKEGESVKWWKNEDVPA